MKRFLFFFFIIFLSSSDNIKLEYNIPDVDFHKISDGIGFLLCGKNAVKGTTKIVKGLVDVVDVVIQRFNLSPEDQLAIQNLFLDFELKINEIRFVESCKKKQDYLALADGISKLIYHLMKLMVFQVNVKYHLRNILAALFNIVGEILQDEEAEADLENLQASIQHILENRKVFKIG